MQRNSIRGIICILHTCHSAKNPINHYFMMACPHNTHVVAYCLHQWSNKDAAAAARIAPCTNICADITSIQFQLDMDIHCGWVGF